MIRKTLATTLVAGAALTGLASTAYAAAPFPSTKPFKVCGKGETRKPGTCVKGAKQTASGNARFASYTQVSGTAVNKTRSTMYVVVHYEWKVGKATRKLTKAPIAIAKNTSKGKKFGDAVPVNGRAVTLVTVRICKDKAKHVCGVKQTIRP